MTGLYWSETGEVGCSDHMPFEGSDTWVFGRWQPVTAADAAAWQQEVGRPMTCETCGAEVQR